MTAITPYEITIRYIYRQAPHTVTYKRTTSDSLAEVTAEVEETFRKDHPHAVVTGMNRKFTVNGETVEEPQNIGVNSYEGIVTYGFRGRECTKAYYVLANDTDEAKLKIVAVFEKDTVEEAHHGASVKVRLAEADPIIRDRFHNIIH